jgi:hypothetical protein
MARQPVNYQPAPELTQVTAAPNIQAEHARSDLRGSNAFRLAEALNVATPVVEKFAQDYERDRLNDQKAKLDHYTETFYQDHQEGAVSQAQIKDRFPETVPVIAARIAEGVGKRDADRQMGAIIEQINGDDSLRLDSTKRAAFIASKRAEIFGKIAPGNEFYSSGFASGMDSQLQQWDNSWKREAASFHEKIQAEDFSKEISTALNGGLDLESIDAKWATSSSLNHIERNRILVSTVTDLAFANDQPELLKKVPTRFLNAASKDALRKTEVQITENRMATVRQAEYLKDRARATDLASAKTEIIGNLVKGQPIDLAKYRGSPEAFAYALQMRETPLMDEATSTSNMARSEQEILNGATVGSAGSAEQLSDQVLKNPSLNPKEKQSLIAKIPKLLEGRSLMEDPTVRQPIADRLNPRLTELSASTNSTLKTLLEGRNLRSEVMKQYDGDIRRSFQAEFEETGKWPMGHRKNELIDKAVDRAEATLERLTKIGATKSDTSKAAPAAAPATAPTFDPKSQKRVEIMPGVFQYVPK